jgi:hypothetical protein
MAASIFTTDHGHTINRATRGLTDSQALTKTLQHTDKELKFWEQAIAYWRAQLRFAERKGRK